LVEDKRIASLNQIWQQRLCKANNKSDNRLRISDNAPCIRWDI
jgi:hypothetical protein